MFSVFDKSLLSICQLKRIVKESILSLRDFESTVNRRSANSSYRYTIPSSPAALALLLNSYSSIAQPWIVFMCCFWLSGERNQVDSDVQQCPISPPGQSRSGGHSSIVISQVFKMLVSVFVQSGDIGLQFGFLGINYGEGLLALLFIFLHSHNMRANISSTQ